jgi:hypothetical protein
MAIAPKATGAVLATEHHGGDGDRRAEAGQRLEQRAEAEGDDDRLDALVVRYAAEGPPEHREVPCGLRHVVDPDRRPDDPHDREQPEYRAL